MNRYTYDWDTIGIVAKLMTCSKTRHYGKKDTKTLVTSYYNKICLKYTMLPHVHKIRYSRNI